LFKSGFSNSILFFAVSPALNSKVSKVNLTDAFQPKNPLVRKVLEIFKYKKSEFVRGNFSIFSIRLVDFENILEKDVLQLVGELSKKKVKCIFAFNKLYTLHSFIHILYGLSGGRS
tara:strand:+ start:631 stop:978 length:348 start_codon:yes stop_codon:yes gene_type:complete